MSTTPLIGNSPELEMSEEDWIQMRADYYSGAYQKKNPYLSGSASARASRSYESIPSDSAPDTYQNSNPFISEFSSNTTIKNYQSIPLDSISGTYQSEESSSSQPIETINKTSRICKIIGLWFLSTTTCGITGGELGYLFSDSIGLVQGVMLGFLVSVFINLGIAVEYLHEDEALVAN